MDLSALFTLENLFTLGMLVMLQAVLGFDNLLYIALESQRVEPAKQAKLRRWGIGLAIFLRIILLFLLVKLISLFQDELFAINIKGFVEGHFNLHSLIVFVGGIFIIYTAIKEISHMMLLEEDINAEQIQFFCLCLILDCNHECGILIRFNFKRHGLDRKLYRNGYSNYYWRYPDDLAFRPCDRIFKEKPHV